MKHVDSLQILGTPEATGHLELSPTGIGAASVHEDGSLLCLRTGQWFAPEPSNPADAEFTAMRRAFDARLGITPSDRLGVSTPLTERTRAAG